MSETRRRWLAIVNPACDGMRNREFRETWLRRLRYGATKVVIDGAGHAANLHQPAAFNRAMESFLAGLPG